jgi:hypothetical protein
MNILFEIDVLGPFYALLWTLACLVGMMMVRGACMCTWMCTCRPLPPPAISRAARRRPPCPLKHCHSTR